MKKVIVLGIVLTMVMAFAAGANAFIIKISSASSDGAAMSYAGQVSNEQNTFSPLLPAQGAEATYAVYEGNVPGGALGHTVKIIDNSGKYTYFGEVDARSGYNGSFDLRFFSTTSATKLAAGDWYLYKGHDLKTATLLDQATFKTAESTWATSTFGAVLANGDKWMLTNQAVPEPGSIVAILSGLAGLVGFGVRRKK